MNSEDDNVAKVKHLLAIPDATASSFKHFRTGARTYAVLALQDELPHNYSHSHPLVTIKLYKGNGSTSGSKEYQHYHQTSFSQVAALQHPNIQQSLAGGVADGVGPYAIMQYVPGAELALLLLQHSFTAEEAKSVVRQILLDIWIPLWDAGLRFKDCHAGNFVYTPDNQVVMIDTEQMRKDVVEMLNTPLIWTQRDKHEASGLKRLAGLLTRIIMSVCTEAREATVKRKVKEALSDSDLLEALSALGRDSIAADSSVKQATVAVEQTINSIKAHGYLS